MATTSSATDAEHAEPSSLAVVSASFLDDIRITFGPHDLIGRFFLQADAATQERGVHLSFAAMEQLVSINRQNPDSWRPLLPHYDPSYWGASRDSAFCLVGRNHAGDVVATQAARLYDFANTNLLEEATSLRLFYPEPERMRRPGESCTITAPSAKHIKGRVAFSGAAWYRPDYRGRELSSILPRISRAYAHTIWNTDVTVTFIAKALVENGAWRRAGYTNLEWDVALRNFVIGPYDGALVWMETKEMLADLSAYMQSAAQIDRRVQQRHA
jgi:hypothetical protein